VHEGIRKRSASSSKPLTPATPPGEGYSAELLGLNTFELAVSMSKTNISPSAQTTTIEFYFPSNTL
jgi:hypothetical protein